MHEIQRLREIVAQLRNPEGGCPWDLEQDFRSIAPHTIEEAYEVADAIERADYVGLRAELGDLLLQVVFHAQMAEEQQLFDLSDVCQGIADKLVRRHPHVFGDQQVDTPAAVLDNWEAIKAEERAEKNQSGLLDDVPRNLPALLRAQKLQKRAARVGLDWSSPEAVVARLLDEVDELCDALGREDDALEGAREELGDILFCCTNLARHLDSQSEDLLRAANNKFTARVNEMERLAARAGQQLGEMSEEQLDKLWDDSKRSLQESPQA